MKFTIKSFEVIAQNALTGTEVYEYLIPEQIYRILNEIFKPETLNLEIFQVECLIKAAVDYNVIILVVMNTVEQGNVYCCVSPQLHHVAIIKSDVINNLYFSKEEYLNLKFIGCGTHCYISLYENYILVGDKTDTTHVVKYTNVIKSEPKMVQAIRAINSKDTYEI